MKRTILGGMTLAAVLTTSMMAEARGRGRTTVRRAPVRRAAPMRRVTPVRKRVVRQPVSRRPVTRRPIAKRPIVKRPIARRPIIGKRPIAKRPIVKRPTVDGRKRILPIRHKNFVRPKGWAKKFHKHYHLKFGKKFRHGHFYRGRHHRHWSSCVYLPRFGCHGYYCPFTYGYYYWCEPHGCYYPVSYCPTGFFTY